MDNIRSDVRLLFAIPAISSFALALNFGLCFHWIFSSELLPLEPLLPHCSPPSFLLTLVHSSAPFPRCHVPAPCGPFLPATFVSLVSSPRHRTHIVERHVVARVLITLRRSRILGVETHQIRWSWSVVGHRCVDDLQLFDDFTEFPRSRPSLTVLLGVLLHYFPQTGAPSLPLSMILPCASP